MARRWSFTVHTRSRAAPDVVFGIVADGARWREWAGPMVPGSMWEREGDPAPGGVGAIRKLGRRPVFAREEIVEYDPPRRLSYVVLSGLPTRDYRADVDLSPDDGGTSIEWRGEFAPSVPGTGSLLRVVLRRIIAGLARRLAAEADRRG